ncbi:MAG: hypothetical protein II951_06530 [Bacteroidales bacterium]|nr:hypothetical protein [Bacteroidales bacterium]
MKNYGLNDVLGFGKYAGERIKDVIDKNPGYIDWCLSNLDHFGLSATARSYMRTGEVEVEEDDDDRYDDRGYYEEPRKRYDEYGGIYDLDDDFINDVLDGDPEAYWNID